MSGDPCIKCSCDTVGWRGDLAKVVSLRRLGLGRAEGVSVVGVLGPTAHPGLPLKVLLGVGRRRRL
jgi:hypothetical protein